MSSATVPLAAEAYGVEPARIAKTLSLRIGERVVLIVAAGTSRMDNKKMKAVFGGNPKCSASRKSPRSPATKSAAFAVRTEVAAADLLRRLAEGFRHRGAHRGSTHSAVYRTDAPGGTDRSEWVDVCELRPEKEAAAYSSSSWYGLGWGCRLAAAFVAARGHVARLLGASTGTRWPVVAGLDSNTARQLLESCGVFCRKQATMRLISGIWSLHSRQTSGVQAICCSQVPRYSCDDAGANAASRSRRQG